ncbi:hypothetical protein BD779DRAFT_1709962 [Infundibulicybe gibba]|nr:hypothetical protein BD779DRAFT_1709962 [Infundibulicybe gibba]
MNELPLVVQIELEAISAFPGPIFLGAILNWGLFCCLAVQVYIYHISSKNDRIYLKLLGFATGYAWQLLVVSWSKIPSLPHIENFLGKFTGQANIVLPVINAIISAVVQIFFPGVLLLNLFPATGYQILITTIGKIFAALIGIVWLGGNLIADILIASSMLYTLHKARRQSLSKGAKTIISRLMVNAIETGAITVIVVGTEIILLLVPLIPTTGDLTIFTYYQTMYPNVCLANLNARARTRRLGNDAQFSTARAGEDSPGLGRANTTLHFAMQSTNVTRSGNNPGGEVETGADPIPREIVTPPDEGPHTSQV